MCIAIYKPEGKILTREALQNCYNSNRDGAGFAYVRPDIGEVCIQKGFFSFDKFYEAFKEFQQYQCLVHFRVATHRVVNGLNCHPWRVNDDLVFVHNGTISGMNQNSDLSDTGNFCAEILTGLMEKYPDFYKTEQFRWLVENSIASFNKLIFLDSKGFHLIVREKEGYWDNDCWFSNKTYSCSNNNFRVVEGQVLPEKPIISTPVKVNSNDIVESGQDNSGSADIALDGDVDIDKIEAALQTEGMFELYATESDLDKVLSALNKRGTKVAV